MFIPNEQLKRILHEAGLLTEEQWIKALANAKRLDIPIEDILREWDIVRGHVLYEAVSHAIGIPYINLKLEHIDQVVLNRFDSSIVGNFKAIPFAHDEGKNELSVAFQDPTDTVGIAQLSKRIGCVIKPFFTGISSYKTAVKYYQRDIAEEIKKSLSAPLGKKKKHIAQALKLFEALFDYIYYSQPSDIHLESHERGGMVKVRIDGFLSDEFSVDGSAFAALCARIKHEAHMASAKTTGSDGRFSLHLHGEHLSFRVSAVPTYFGENIVLRVRNESTQKMSLHDLGFRSEDIDEIKKEIGRPYGLVLVVGPTGSGKTSTLYTIVKSLNVEGVSISTIEDPVEYALPHVNQTQVNSAGDMTFVDGLRSILRQDPNIIMVGEMRDEQAATIAIQAALTGHLVLSTLHANSAAGALTRLHNMGIRPYLLAPTINQIISQHLVQHLCQSCIVEYKPSRSLLRHLEETAHLSRSLFRLARRGFVKSAHADKLVFYRGTGCDKCGGAGKRGRIGLFEILTVNESIRHLIQQKKSEGAVARAAEHAGMLTLFDDGLLKVIAGQTSIEEVLKVA